LARYRLEAEYEDLFVVVDELLAVGE